MDFFFKESNVDLLLKKNNEAKQKLINIVLKLKI
jgi:hypothetical protein